MPALAAGVDAAWVAVEVFPDIPASLLAASLSRDRDSGGGGDGGAAGRYAPSGGGGLSMDRWAWHRCNGADLVANSSRSAGRYAYSGVGVGVNRVDCRS